MRGWVMETYSARHDEGSQFAAARTHLFAGLGIVLFYEELVCSSLPVSTTKHFGFGAFHVSLGLGGGYWSRRTASSSAVVRTLGLAR